MTATRANVTGFIALAGMLCFVAIIVTLHLTRTDVDPLSLTTSHYAVGPHGFLMMVAFVSMSAATWALLAGLSWRTSPQARSLIGLGLLAVWALGVLIAAAFPIDAEGDPSTTSGLIHRINGPVIFVALTLGMVLVSRRFEHDDAWRPIHRSAIVFSWLNVALTLILIPNIAAGSDFAGLVQRLSLIVIVAWYVVVAAHLRSLADSPGRSRQA